ncbi:SdrD B-like domain-containing protein [Listeria booriae]|uniref:BIG2 domain-containing protein n=1 Tax=Listeria booriae TaxID=1552123 RepID=A0A7X0XJM6_9LIST|nr:SdrD B-like domain-containing protein [Listeria booriae]MBC1562269.1 hypothetical protein [Listeria booriae]
MQNNHSFKKLGKTTLVGTLALGMMVTPIISSIQANAAEGAKGSISDAMFEDLNGNGQKDANEAGISGIKVTLFNDQGVEVATTTSAADGSYNFDNVDEGTYYMHVDTATFPDNYKLFTTQGFGSDGNSSYFHVAAGETVSGYHLGFYKKAGGTISSTVFNDLNINGKQDEGEAGLSGAKVALYNVSGEKIAETTTAADGSYTFANIPAGTYYEHVTLPKNAKLVSGEQFGSDGNTGYFAVNSEQQITNLNVGAKINTAAISGTITDKASQQGMKDVEMVLYTIDGTRVASTTTDASGNYKFANLAEDFYYVHAIVPDGDSVVDTHGFGMDAYSYYIQIGADTQADNFNLTLKGNTVEPTDIVVNTDNIAAKVGDKGKIDASVQPSDATDKTLTYTVSDPSILSVDADGNWTALAKGEADITVTTANGISKVIHVVVSEKVGELKSFVFEDTNKNGTKEAGEAGVPGATVALHGADGSVVATQTTDANGQYDFKDVPVGTYYIVVTAPAGYDIKSNHAFGTDGVTGYINVTESVVTNYECALIKDVAPITVSSIKWINNKDGSNVELMDRDNIQIQDNYVDADNNPIVNIKLYDQNNNVIDLTGYTVTMGDDTIATGAIDGNNVELTRHKAGATSVTIKDPSGRVVKNFVLNITASVIPATDITLGATNIDTTIGTTGKIDATVQPANATDKSLTYTSANTNILTVATDGTWEAQGEGTTTVTVKTANNITKTITVNVTKPTILPTGVTVANSAVTTKVANTGSISATVQPANATDKTLTYTSSNPSILKVNADGSWEAMNNGTATVTVRTSNGLTTTVTFTVQAYFSTILEQGNFNPDKASGGPVTYYDSIADLSASDNITLTYNTLDAKVADATQTNGRRQFIFYVDGNPVNFNTDYSFSITNQTVLNSDISNNTEGARALGHIEVKVTKGTSKITVTRTSDGKVVKTINVTVQ